MTEPTRWLLDLRPHESPDPTAFGLAEPYPHGERFFDLTVSRNSLPVLDLSKATVTAFDMESLADLQQCLAVAGRVEMALARARSLQAHNIVTILDGILNGGE